jgi:midasin
LAEKGGSAADIIKAHPDFRLVATMNPGGDYGKKELSPALTNRFTSIWVPAIEDENELLAIIHSRLDDTALRDLVAARLQDFWRFFKAHVADAARQALTIRDILAWIAFVRAAAPEVGALIAYAHGAHLVLLDGIGLGVGLPEEVRPHQFD